MNLNYHIRCILKRLDYTKQRKLLCIKSAKNRTELGAKTTEIKVAKINALFYFTLYFNFFSQPLTSDRAHNRDSLSSTFSRC